MIVPPHHALAALAVIFLNGTVQMVCMDHTIGPYFSIVPAHFHIYDSFLLIFLIINQFTNNMQHVLFLLRKVYP